MGIENCGTCKHLMRKDGEVIQNVCTLPTKYGDIIISQRGSSHLDRTILLSLRGCSSWEKYERNKPQRPDTGMEV